MARKSKRPLKNDLEFYLDGFTVIVKRWGQIIITGGHDDHGPATREKAIQRVRERVDQMAKDGGWN